MSGRYLIITADDFGLHPRVNEAVRLGCERGILTAASLMVAAPAADEAVRIARDLPQLAVGLHVVLADGPAALPAHEIPDLVGPDGRFGSDMARAGVRFYALPRVRAQLEAEIRAQFAAFARTGLRLDHVNAHKHFHLHPTVLTLLLRIARDYGAPGVRLPSEPAWIAAGGGATRAQALAQSLGLRPWLALMRRRLRRAGVIYNDQVFGIARSGNMDEAALLAVLARLPAGVTEIYLHPATAAGEPISAGMRDYAHARELEALLSPRVRAALEASGARRGGFAGAAPGGTAA